MSILVDRELHELAKAGAVDPFEPENVQPTSIDLRLGTTFRISRRHRTTSIDLARVPHPDEVTQPVTVPLWRSRCPECNGVSDPNSDNVFGCVCAGGWVYDESAYFVIHPGEAVLGSTLERLCVPPNIIMTLEGKSSLSRLFLLPHAQAGYFDPGWDGVGTLEMVNLGDAPIVLRPGCLIVQSRWMRLESAPDRLYGDARLGSHYKGDMVAMGSRYGR